MEKFIVKLQRALFPENSSLLISNRDKTLYQQLPYEGPLVKAIGDRDKVYLEVSQRADGVLVLHREVKAKW
ncbi:hypothetical protein GXP70_18200 [Paenibacillus lycopersici]|uniref:Uncharacterized protein n=1 Tax=Paenibacillus lycopersici TaxID=2704462 RepID=A0A6C0G6T1_9BACL|nr:hypothetical protein [Paenibacillus lycopersici]QHT61715.1 hypothetical protein GXP70_18200 [Paenibacillus lycopersici]